MRAFFSIEPSSGSSPLRNDQIWWHTRAARSRTELQARSVSPCAAAIAKAIIDWTVTTFLPAVTICLPTVITISPGGAAVVHDAAAMPRGDRACDARAQHATVRALPSNRPAAIGAIPVTLIVI